MSRILIVDDEAKLRTLIAMALEAEGWETLEAGSGEEALHVLEKNSFDVLITDIRMPGISGLELLKKAKGLSPSLEFLVMTAYADAATGVEAMRSGALEYLIKPFEMDELTLLVKTAIERRKLKLELSDLREREFGRYRLDRIVGHSKAMQEVIRQCKMVATRDTTVLIRGNSGTGKELIARGIHNQSGREVFVAVNCGAVPENLLESELFGHEKGSFTGAATTKIGYFERAGLGTIFLDEIGDVSPAMQVKLLRVLQEKEFTRVGGQQVLKTQARVITATHRNLEEEVEQKHFRQDLYYRLNVFPVFVPSLSERLVDIPDLVDTFLKKFRHEAGLAEGVLSKLLEYSWPGNVRELENCLERAAIMAAGKSIELHQLPEYVRSKKVLEKASAFRLPETGLSLEELEKSLVLQALDMAKGNKTKAAVLLGISRRALYSKMHTHSIRGYGEEESVKAE